MSHHPLDWLFEYEDMEDVFEKRIQVLLCGHKHRHRVRSSGYTVVHSGALHPDRHEDGWDPRYNVISLSISREDDNFCLNVRVYERQYSLEHARFSNVFNPDSGEQFREHCYPLGTWQPSTNNTPPLESSSDLVTVSDESQPINPRSTPQTMTRSLLYRFYNLPFYHQIEILSNMHLLEEDDQLGTTQELLRHALERVKAEGRAVELDKEIEKREGRR